MLNFPEDIVPNVNSRMGNPCCVGENDGFEESLTTSDESNASLRKSGQVDGNTIVYGKS